MTQINVHSQNLRGCVQATASWILSTLNDAECECTAILLQDIGLTELNGPPFLRNVLGEHPIFANFSMNNKARNVAVIVNKSGEIRNVLREQSGSALGIVIGRGKFEILIISAYLPATTDCYGVPLKWDATDQRPGA